MGRILLVDDEDAIGFAFSRVLRDREKNVAVDTAQSVHEAEQLLAENRYGAAIVDLRLTGADDMDGLQVVQMTREQQAECKIIVITAYGGEKIRKTVFDTGADHYLEKPVSPQRIREVLGTMGIYD